MDCKLRAKNCGGCPMLATEYAAQLKKKEADVRALLGLSLIHISEPTRH